MTNRNLFEAVKSGRFEDVKRALTEEKINAASYYGAKSVILASEKGYIEILRVLLEDSAKIHRASFWSNSYNIALSSLSKAARNGHHEIVKLLLKYGANTEKKDMREAFVEALLSGNLEITKMLLDAGANVNIKDDKGFTPLMLAILLPSENPESLVEWLLTAGAYVNVKRKTWEQKGRRNELKISTALTYAEELGNTRILEMLKNAKKYRSFAGAVMPVFYYSEKTT